MPLQYFVILLGIHKMNRKHRILPIIAVFVMSMVAFALAGCGAGSGLEDGEYTVDVTTDSNMFHINEANEGKGLLTVKDGEMTVHVSLASKKIVNVYLGSKEDAQKEGAELIEPTTDRIVYDDGIEMDVYGFDIPVPALDEEIPVAIIGTHDNCTTTPSPCRTRWRGTACRVSREMKREKATQKVTTLPAARSTRRQPWIL